MRKNDYFMHVPGDPRLGLIVNCPAALEGGGVHGLPPHAPVRASRVDCYPGCPADWPRSSGNTSSWFVPIVEGRGMWLDFNPCWGHPHHVAVVVSIQGVNPLTGRKADKLELEAYKDDGEVEKWLRGRQNYLATTSTPRGLLWIDGFRAKDGTVRQYIFTREERRGVAAQLIGVDRVFAIGAAFFLSKEPKPPEVSRGDLMGSGLGWGAVPGATDTVWKTSLGDSASGVFLNSTASGGGVEHAYHMTASYCAEDASKGMRLISTKGAIGAKGAKGDVGSRKFSAGPTYAAAASAMVPNTEVLRSLKMLSMADAATLEIGAGAEIDQTLYKDTVGLEFWQPKCAGVVAISYAPADIIKMIFEAGEVAEPEGFLEKLEVGNK